MAKRGREGLLIGGLRKEDVFEKFKLSFPQFENLYTENVMELWGDVVFSMRFQRLTEGRNKDAETAWIEHTPIYKDQYLQDEQLKDFEANYTSYLDIALESGLLNDELYKEAKDANGLLNIISHMNLIGFMASDRVFQHLSYPRVTHGVPISLTGNYVRAKQIQGIDRWGSRKDGELIVPTDTKCKEALIFLLETNGYYRINKKYLLPATAQVNVRVGGFTHNSNVVRESLIKVVDDSTINVELREPIDVLPSLEPSVISLFSKSFFLGEDIYFEFMGYEAVQKVSVQEISNQLNTADNYLSGYKNWLMHFERAKKVLTSQERLGWEKKIEKFKELQFARDFWRDLIHNIAHEWNADERDEESIIEQQFHYLEILMKNPDLICSWQDDDTYTDLVALSGEGKNQSDQEATEVTPDPEVVKTLQQELERLSESSEPELDPEKVEFVAECLLKYMEEEGGNGINLKETLFFLDCCKNHESEKTIKYRKQAYTSAYDEVKVPKRVPLDAKQFISSIINEEHEEGVTTPPTAHPIYQSWLKLFPKSHYKEEEVGGKTYLVRTTFKGMSGITAWEMATWLLTNLPRKTAQRIEQIKRDLRLGREAYEYREKHKQ